MTDFFGSQRPVELMDALLQDYNLTTPLKEEEGVASMVGVQTADEPKAVSAQMGQQAKQLDEHDHLVCISLLALFGDSACARTHTHTRMYTSRVMCAVQPTSGDTAHN